MLFVLLFWQDIRKATIAFQLLVPKPEYPFDLAHMFLVLVDRVNGLIPLEAPKFRNVFPEEVGMSLLVINPFGLIESHLQLIEELLIFGWKQVSNAFQRVFLIE